MTQLRNIFLILTFNVIFFACRSNSENKLTNVGPVDSSTVSLTNKETHRFIPEEKTTEKFDTILENRQLQISIKRTDLDSYVINEYADNGSIRIDKYRDAEISLTIIQKSQIILDTLFRKEQFSKYEEKGFMELAIFHNYWFNNLHNDRIEFLGVISKPETDWTLDFHHYFDITNKKLTFKQMMDDAE